MIILITGPSHTGKTFFAQKLLEEFKFPYLSIDHLKMGLIRSKHTDLTPLSSDELLTNYLWPIVAEIIKTAIENNQNLIVEGCYIPFDWENYFTSEYKRFIKYNCLIMSEQYIKKNYLKIIEYANVIENRITDEDFNTIDFIKENQLFLKKCQENNLKYIYIDEEFPKNLAELIF